MGKNGKEAERASQRKPEWHTALFYFLEGIRDFSRTKINYKNIYAPVSTREYFISHENPGIRKVAASYVSRTIHSERYVDDMQKKHEEDSTAFARASQKIYHELIDWCGYHDIEVYRFLVGSLWDDVSRGFANEKLHGRPTCDLKRLEREMESVFRRYWALPEDERPNWSMKILSSYYHALAYGFVNARLAYVLSDETPEELSAVGCDEVIGADVCLVRVYDGETIGGVWKLDPVQTTRIGRFTDCEITEANPCVSRLHCRITHTGEGWTLEDVGSTHGTVVMRSDGDVSLNGADEARLSSIMLRHGDQIVLAHRVRYWFGKLSMEAGLDY